MTTQFQWPEPKWLADIQNVEERECSRIKWLLSMACVYHSATGRPGTLANAVGLSANAFSIIKSRGKITPETAIAIERELGRDLFPRELFRPDLFIIRE